MYSLQYVRLVCQTTRLHELVGLQPDSLRDTIICRSVVFVLPQFQA